MLNEDSPQRQMYMYMYDPRPRPVAPPLYFLHRVTTLYPQLQITYSRPGHRFTTADTLKKTRQRHVNTCALTSAHSNKVPIKSFLRCPKEKNLAYEG